jgi:cytochrome-b5 reductase
LDRHVSTGENANREQHITVACNIDGKEISRSYTPTSSDDEPGYFDLLIKVQSPFMWSNLQSYPTGNVSKAIGLLKIGDTIKVKGPKGQMVYRPGLVRAFGMIAGGTGITPMLQIIRAILKNPSDRTQISLIFANVNEDDILLRKELEQLAEDEKSRFKLYLVLNNPPAEGWTGGVGFVTEDMIKEHCPKPAKDIKILMCGPPPMISGMKKHCVVYPWNDIANIRLDFRI